MRYPQSNQFKVAEPVILIQFSRENSEAAKENKSIIYKKDSLQILGQKSQEEPHLPGSWNAAFTVSKGKKKVRIQCLTRLSFGLKAEEVITMMITAVLKGFTNLLGTKC